MKKIVALVLALALALSLCTVAMAKTTTNKGTTATVSYDKATLYELGDTKGDDMVEVAPNASFTSISKTVTTEKIDNDTVYYVADRYAMTLDTGVETMSVVTKDYADYMLKLDGVKVYLINEPEIKTSKVFTKAVEAADEVACGVYVTKSVDGTETTDVFVDADGDAFVDGAGKWGYYNGTFVTYGDPAYLKAHVLTFDKYGTYKLNSDNKKVPLTVRCSECEKSFDVVKSGKLDKEWKVNVNYQAVNNNTDIEYNFGKTQYYAVLNSVVGGSTATTTTTVDSSKTFDAGVAMYVGLSLMSVAGSAVVIGKKKEF